MFPNDDICNVEVAKSAAQRLFKKYKNMSNKEQPNMGKNEVGKLMKDTYDAINMRNRLPIQPTIPMRKTSSPLSMCSTPTVMARFN